MLGGARTALTSDLLSRSGETTMPTELELKHIISSIQDLLHSASDISHDRCVKVLTARAKVLLRP